MNTRIYIYPKGTFIKPHEGKESMSAKGPRGGIKEGTILIHGSEEAGHSAIHGTLGTVSIFSEQLARFHNF